MQYLRHCGNGTTVIMQFNCVFGVCICVCMFICVCMCVQVSLLLLPSVDDFEEQLLSGLTEDLIYEVRQTNQY